MTEAIFGLIGVIIGALVTGGMSLLLEWHRERREGLTARRLLEFDLTVIEARVEQRLEEGVWSPLELGDRLEQWSRYRPLLARTMSEEDWNDLVVAYHGVELMNTRLESRLGLRQELREEDQKGLRVALAEIQSASKVVQRLAAAQPWWRK